MYDGRADEADDIITSFGLSEPEMKSYETVRNKFENHFIAKRNVIFEGAKFNIRVQDENEPVEDFITNLHCLAKYCEFGALKDQLIQDRIVVGLRNKKLSEKLQLDASLTLEKQLLESGKAKKLRNSKASCTDKNPPEVMSITLITSLTINVQSTVA